jgi:hypothetical protein
MHSAAPHSSTEGGASGNLIYLILLPDFASRNSVTVAVCGDLRMTTAMVMVSLTLGQSNQARLEIAGQLAERFGAGIAGAYDHSRFRELILGGMTQHLVTQNLRCGLLSH